MVATSATMPVAGAGRVPSVSPGCVMLLPGDKLPAWVFADLRTDHAGEVGAVCIYQGVLQFARDPMLRAFAEHHLATEQKHLRLIAGWLPPAQYSRLLPLWRLAGFLTGALPALFGARPCLIAKPTKWLIATRRLPLAAPAKQVWCCAPGAPWWAQAQKQRWL